MRDVDFLLLDGDDVRVAFHCAPGAVGLDGQVVAVHLDPEEAALAPIGAPTVSAHPEFHSVLLAPANNCDLVIDLW